MRFTILIGSLLFPASIAFSQTVDPSNVLLLKGGSKAPSKETLDSSRYTVKPAPTPAPKRERVPMTESSSGGKAASSTESNPVQQTQKIETLVPVESPADEAATGSSVNQAPAGVGMQMQQIFLGGTEDEIEEYKRRLHPLDQRNNLVEIQLAPALIYVESRSNYWFRNYISSGPGLSAGATFWLTPFFGIQGSYLTSLSGEMRGDAQDSRSIRVDHQWFNAGFRFRKFFGFSRRAASLSIGLDFDEYTMEVPADATERIGVKTKALRLSLEAMTPAADSANWAWIWGAELLPRSDHQELQTGVEVSSGAKDATNAVGIWLGSNYTFNRNNQFFLLLSHRLEKSLYEGSADQPDPKTGATPQGVSVQDGTTILRFGYRWGN